MSGLKITDRITAVHRVAQVAWFQEGVVSPQAFVPRPKDHGELSLFNKGDTPQQALNAWNQAFRNSALKNCLTLSVGQFNDLEIEVWETPTRNFPTHASAIFTGKSDDDIEVITALLAEAATIWPPPKKT